MKKFQPHYVWQPMIALTCVFIALVIMGGFVVVQAPSLIGVASLGATGYILFCGPHKPSADVRVIVGGYLISVIVGITFLLISQILTDNSTVAQIPLTREIFAVVAMAVSTVGMLAMRVSHPPAVGFSLGLVVEPWPMPMLLVILSTVVVMLIIKALIRPYMVNLY